MPAFSKKSLERLHTCNIDLVTIFNEVIKVFDCTVSEGYRGEKAQNEAFDKGFSKVRYPNGNHNTNPSNAVDVYPYPVNLHPDSQKEKELYIQRMCYFAGWVMGIADNLYKQKRVSHRLKWGSDWDGDNELSDHSFRDYPHFELIKP